MALIQNTTKKSPITGIENFYEDITMRAFRVGQTLVCTSIIAACSHLLGINEEEAPGYRATYPNQVILAEQLSIPPRHTRKGPFSYGDATAFLTTNLFSSTSGSTDLVVGARRVRLGLGQKVAPHESLYGVLGLNADYRALDGWDWIGNIVLQPQIKSKNIARSSRYIAAMNGRYAASSATGLHVGFYAELGMRASIVHPLIGIDYTAGPWLLQAVYPIKAGISYRAFQSHIFSLMARPVYTAIRLHKALYNRPGIGCYKAMGLEFRWDWAPEKRWNFWAAVGSTLPGSLTLGDKNNNHRHTIHLKTAPYFNVGLTWSIS